MQRRARADCVSAEAKVGQAGDTAHAVLAGDGDLDAVAAQACRFLRWTSTGVAGRGWGAGIR